DRSDDSSSAECPRSWSPIAASHVNRLPRRLTHHHATVPDVRALLEQNDFVVRRVVERKGVMRFANGAALFSHHFIRLGFLDAWKKVVPGKEELIFRHLLL